MNKLQGLLQDPKKRVFVIGGAVGLLVLLMFARKKKSTAAATAAAAASTSSAIDPNTGLPYSQELSTSGNLQAGSIDLNCPRFGGHGVR